MSKLVGMLLLAVGATTAAHAATPHFFMNKPTAPMSAPEIDPASAISAMTLLSGALLVVRGRRSNKQ